MVNYSVSSYGVGIDLGTSFVAAALVRSGQIELATLGERSWVTPSVVFIHEDGTVITGEAAERRALCHPRRAAREFKRRIGDTTGLVLGGTPYSAPALLGQLLTDVVHKVTEQQGARPDRIVLTHPANWGPYQRERFAEVPRFGGLDQVGLVSESEAAAAYYGVRTRLDHGDLVAVYDLGGGTFDATVLRKRSDGFDILGTPEGIERLGGIDFDEAIVTHVNQLLDGALDDLDPRDPRTAAVVSRLRQDCMLAKEALSVDTEITIPVFLPNRHDEIRLTRGEFETMVRPPIESTIGALHRALQIAQVAPAELAAVVLVGGSSRIPLVGQMISEELGRPTAVDGHPKYAVALGAAMLARPPGVQSERRPGDHDTVTLAVTPNGDTGVVPGPASVAVPRPTGYPPGPRTWRAAPRPARTAFADPEVIEAHPDRLPPGRDSVAPGRDGVAHRRRKAALLTAVAIGAVTLLVLGVLMLKSRSPANPPLGPGAAADGPARLSASVATPTVGAVIPAGRAPSAVAVTPSGRYAYLACRDESSLRVIDTVTNGVTATIPVPGSPQFIAFTPDGRRGYVSLGTTAEPAPAGSAGNAVAAVDTASNTVIDTIPVDGLPAGLAVAPDGRHVYVPNYAAGTMSVIDTATNTVTSTIAVAPTPYAVAFSPDSRRGYLTSQNSHLVSVFDTATNRVTSTIAVGPSPQSLALAPDGRNAYVANSAGNTVSVIDTLADRFTTSIPVGASPRSVAFAPDGEHAYVANSTDNTVSVIATATNRVTATVPVGNEPSSVAIRPDGRHAYVADTGSGELSVLNTGT